MMTKGQKIIAVLAVGILILLSLFFTAGTNPILHLMYSDEYMFETAMKSDIVKAFHEMYPESKTRYVRELSQSPAVVFEMKQDMRRAFLAVGNFEGRNLGYLYHCMAPDYSFQYFSVEDIYRPADITQNPCFT